MPICMTTFWASNILMYDHYGNTSFRHFFSDYFMAHFSLFSIDVPIDLQMQLLAYSQEHVTGLKNMMGLENLQNTDNVKKFVHFLKNDSNITDDKNMWLK